MTFLQRPLHAAARHGRVLLVLGLAAGVALPHLAAAMRPLLDELVALLLFLAVLRIGPRQALGAVSDLRTTAAVVALYQIVLPLLALAAFALLELGATVTAMAVVLMFAAAPLSGSPNLTILAGFAPAPALRLVVLGTATLPLTVLPVFWLMPQLDDASAILGSAGRLLAVVAFAALAAAAVRVTLLRDASAGSVATLDGLSAITMAVMVVGLMSAVGPTLATAPGELLYWLAVAVAVNFGAQAAAAVVLGRAGAAPHLVPFSIVAGNRNVALFLVSLPREVADPLLVFIGCYQVPMYLTPLLLRGFYRWRSRVASGG